VTLVPNYIRNVRYVRTIDGDTFEGILDHGMYAGVRALTQVEIRLHGIDTWEMHERDNPQRPAAMMDERGVAARDFTQAVLEDAERIVVQTYKPSGKPIGTTWSRVVADVEVDGQDLAALLRENGHEKHA